MKSPRSMLFKSNERNFWFSIFQSSNHVWLALYFISYNLKVHVQVYFLKMLYLHALQNGFAQSGPKPPFMGSPATFSSSPPLCVPPLKVTCSGSTHAGLTLSKAVCIYWHTLLAHPLPPHRSSLREAQTNDSRCCLWVLWRERERAALLFSGTALHWDRAQISI